MSTGKFMITPSKRDEYPFLADWFSISLRWLVMLGVASSLLMTGTLNWPVIYLILFCVIWNLFASILAMSNHRIPAHRLVFVAVDAVITVLFYYFGGGLTGPLVWVSLMALFSAAVYFEWQGSVLIAVVLSLLQSVLFVLQSSAEIVLPMQNTLQPLFPAVLYLSLWQFLVGLGLFNLLIGLAFGLLSRQFMKSARRHYQNLITKRHDDELRAQRRERNRMRIIFDMIETLSSSLDYQTVIETSLDMCSEAVGVYGPEKDTLIRAALLFDEHDLVIQSGRGIISADLRQTFPANGGVLRDVLQTAKPQVIRQPMQDPELGRLMSLQTCHSALLLPLHRGLNAFGVMLFAHPDEAFFNTDRCEILEVLSHQVVVVIQNARLFQDVAEEKQRIVETQEEARKKLARDLHDGPTQTVSAIAMRLSIARRLLDEQKLDEAAEELGMLEDLARRSTHEIRTMLFTLRPLVLESDGLLAALQAMADKMRDTYRQNVTVEVDPETLTMLEINKQSVIFSLAEEAVNNARKHAQASEIRVRLRFAGKDKSIGLLEIDDDGVGFDVKAINNDYERRGSFGMVNLRERTDLVNGVLHIESTPGKGTRVQVAVPFTQEAIDRLQRLR
ncbi:MAG: histidine kinase [Anaerolineae bacterium]|nr:histidine kinase [Anaerolineae bacterium]